MLQKRLELLLGVLMLVSMTFTSSVLGSSDIMSPKYESKLKKLNTLFGSSFKTVDGVKETTPLKFDELSSLVDNFFPMFDDSKCYKNETCAKNWMKDFNLLFQRLTEKQMFLDFYHHINQTVEESDKSHEFGRLFNKFEATSKKHARLFLKYARKWDAGLRRMFYLVTRGLLLNSNKAYDTLKNQLKQLHTSYINAQVCETETSCARLKPFVKEVFGKSQNYSHRLLAWKSVQSSLGSPSTRTLFNETLATYNMAAKANKYKDLSDIWISEFETKHFDRIIDKLFVEVKPLYVQLHKYVKKILHKTYSESLSRTSYDKKFIQEHLLGSPLDVDDWSQIYDLVKPYPNAKSIDVNSLLKEKGYAPQDLFKEAEKFFVSLDLFKMNPTFWKFSILEKPADRSIVCYPLTYDFLNGFDYRIKMCTNVSIYDFATVHKKLAYVEYDIAYRNIYPKFREPATKSFRDGFADAIVLSTINHQHLKNINLIDASTQIDNEQEINFLMQMALKKISALAFSYTAHKWSSQVFQGRINSTEYNKKWWEMRNGYNGVEAPVERTEDNFDAASTYRIHNFMPYTNLFVSSLLEFQIYDAMCQESGHKGDLHTCDFYNSKTAGQKLKSVLELGISRAWNYALQKLTGKNKLSVKPLMDYFKPLTAWLEKENARK